MRKVILPVIVFCGFVLFACNNQKNQQEVRPAEQSTTPFITDEIVNNFVTDKDGNMLEMSFNNTQGTAILKLNGETIPMKRDITASGIRMSNSDYEYEEWQGHVVLKKNGEIVFDNKDQIHTSVKDKEGRTLDLSFNNNNGTVTLKLAGQEEVLRADTMTSGLRYRNDQYLYEEWQGHITVKKDNKVIFDNQK